MCKKTIFLISLCLVLALAGNALAATRYWSVDPCDGNRWIEPNNWCTGSGIGPRGYLPDIDDNARFNESSGLPNKCVVADGDTAVCDQLQPGWQDSGNFYFEMTGGNLRADNYWRIGNTPEVHGYIDISGGTIWIGNNRWHTPHTYNCNATVDISGGDIYIDHDWRAPHNNTPAAGRSNANVTITGGTITTDRDIRFSHAANTNSTVAISGDPNIDCGRDFFLGRQGDCTATISGGTITCDRDFRVAWGEDYPAEYTPDQSGISTLEINGGTINCGRDFRIARSKWNAGTVVTMNDGDISCTDVYVGLNERGGIGKFVMNGGTLTTSDDLRVPNSEGCEGRVEFNGGTIHIGDQFGRDTDANYTRVDVNDYVTITFDGSNMNNIGEWLNNDWLVYNGTDPAYGNDPYDDRHFVYDYNITNVDMTTLTAIPASDINFAQAWHPLPFNGDSSPGDMNGMVELYWTRGDWALGTMGHSVFFGSELDDVNWYDMNDARIGNDPCLLWQGLQTEPNFGPVDINLGTDFFWRIDEVNTSSPTGYDKGQVWQYHINNHFSVDNYESYDGTEPYEYYPGDPLEPNSLRYFWRDQTYDQGVYGYLVHYTAEVYLHQASPRRNTASMRLKWNNYYSYSVPPRGYSEAEYPFGDFQNWTVEEVGGLRMDYQGDDPCDPQNPLEPLNVVDQNERIYVVLEDYDGNKAWQYCGEPNDLITDEWNRCYLDLVDFTGVDLNEVNSIYVGVGDRGYNQGEDRPVWGEGNVWVDNIRLYPPHCEKVLDARDEWNRFAPHGEFVGWTGGCTVEYREMRRIANRWLNQDYTRTIPERTGELVGHWKFDESSGDVAADSSGKGHNATLKNMTDASWGHPKPAELLPSGTSLFSDPNAGDGHIVDANYDFDYVIVPYSEDFNDVGDDKLGMTWAAWVKTNYSDPCARWDWWFADDNETTEDGGTNDANFPRVTIIAKADPDPCEMPFGSNVTRLRLSAKGELRYQCKNNFRALDTDVADDTWHHVAVTVAFQKLKDGSLHESDDTARIYVDGVEEELFGSGDPCDPCDLPESRGYGYDGANQQGQADPNHVIVIGGKTGSGAHPFSGWIDDVQIYNRALVPDPDPAKDEIKIVMSGGTAPTVIVPEEEVPIYWGDGNNEYNMAIEAEGSRIINFKEFAYIAEWWLRETLWPAEPVKP